MKDLFSIGYLSKIFDTSVKTLRYYDKIGLFKPDYIDKETNYRYYTANQITLLYIIKELKYQGFALADIQKFLSEEDFGDIETLYVNRKKEIDNEIEHLNLFKDRLEQKIDLLRGMKAINKDLNDKNFSINIAFKSLPKRKVLFLRKSSPFTFMGVTLRTIELFNQFPLNNLHMVDPYIIIFHDDYKNLNSFYADYEICVGIDSKSLEKFYKKIGDKEVPFIREIPEMQCVTSINKGSYEESMPTYNEMLKWIENNGYKIAGPTHKEYIANFALVKSVGNIIYELQIPVEKK